MTKLWHAVIVDDELPARQRLRTLLAAHPEVQIVGEAADVPAAESLCNQHSPDILFLDVQLRQTSGFDLLPRLLAIPAVILVSAYENFGVQAFDLGVRDYLLKPVNPERLARAIRRITSEIPGDTIVLEKTTVLLQANGRFERFPVADITHVEAMDNYSRVYFKSFPALMVRRTIQQWRQILPEPEFLRVERSLILNLTSVIKCKSISRDAFEVNLAKLPHPLLLGRSAAIRLRQAMRQNPESA